MTFRSTTTVRRPRPASACSRLTAYPRLLDEDRPEPVAADVGDLALLVYTSGTTGRPKGVMLTHGNLIAMATSGVASLSLSPSDRCLLILPLFHVNGIVVGVLTPFLACGSTAIAGRFDPAQFFRLVEHVRRKLERTANTSDIDDDLIGAIVDARPSAQAPCGVGTSARLRSSCAFGCENITVRVTEGDPGDRMPGRSGRPTAPSSVSSTTV